MKEYCRFPTEKYDDAQMKAGEMFADLPAGEHRCYPIAHQVFTGDRLVNRLPTGDDYCYDLPREGDYIPPGNETWATGRDYLRKARDKLELRVDLNVPKLELEYPECIGCSALGWMGNVDRYCSNCSAHIGSHFNCANSCWELYKSRGYCQWKTALCDACRDAPASVSVTVEFLSDTDGCRYNCITCDTYAGGPACIKIREDYERESER